VSEPIAVVGMACRFPGAENLGGFWRVIDGAEVHVGSVPPDRWDHRRFYDPDPRAVDKAYTDRIATVPGDVLAFPARHFGLSPRRVEVMDPQHRLLLQVAREALQDADLERRPFDRSRTGVFVGISVSEFKDLLLTRLRAGQMLDGRYGAAADERLSEEVAALVEGVAPTRAYSHAGTLLNLAAAAVSQAFDLQGPALALDTACSSALMAVHESVLHLRTGQCDTALAGGVYLALAPDNLVGFSRIGAVSPSGACRPFDERADGFVLGEGAGLVVLRRLADARRDGDRIYAVLRGTGVSNDGRADGPMTPRPAGQRAALARAYADAGVSPATVGLVEAHGTATPVGDRVELDVLREVMSASCALTSVKANIGHTMSAAGIAGFIKAVLCLSHARIPPQPDRLSGPMDDAPPWVPATSEPWPAPDDLPRRAAVSSFGFGGTNVHAVLEESPTSAVSRSDSPQLVLCSADTPALLAAHARDLADTIARDPGIDVASVARTLGARWLLPCRAALVVTGRDDLLRALRGLASAVDEGGPAPEGCWWCAEAPETEPRVAFLFPGQASRPLADPAAFGARFPAFGHRLAQLAADVPELPWEAAEGDPQQESLLRRTDLLQPLLTGYGIAIAELLVGCGVHPFCSLGHSVGEFAAAAAAGAADADDILRFTVERGSVMHRLAPAEPSGMLALSAGRSVVADLLDGVGGAWISAVNGPRQVVVGGLGSALATVQERAGQARIPSTTLPVEFAFHTPLVAAAEAQIQPLVAALPLHETFAGFVSTTTGRSVRSGVELANAWQSQATRPVLFADALSTCRDLGTDIVVQVCGGRSLAGPVQAAGIRRYVAATADEDVTAFLACLAQLAVLGAPVDPRAIGSGSASGSADRVWLPPSPLAAEVYTAVRPSNRVTSASGIPGLRVAGPRVPEVAAAVAVPPVAVDGIAEQVRSVVAEVCAFPEEMLELSAALIDDLGFDSLMLVELDDHLSGRWPELGPLPPELVSRRTTIRQLAEHVGARIRITPTTDTLPVTDTPAPRVPSPVVPAELAVITAFPEVVALDRRLGLADELGVRNPYEHVLTPGSDRSAGGAPRIEGRDVVTFASYDYLGLAHHPAVIRAAQQAAEELGTSVSASRIASGERPVHVLLERLLADFLGVEGALTFVSGHATNVTTVGHLLGPDDLFVHDALAHDSLLQGGKLSGARRMPFPHNDLAALDRLLTSARARYRRVLIAAEGVYSMDGDLCDLAGLVEIKKRHGALLLIDEAHSLGVLGSTGAGIGEHVGADRADVDIWMGTLSKALASCGGYIAGSATLVRFLRYTAPGFAYSVGMPPPAAAAAAAAVEVLRGSPALPARVRSAARQFLRLAGAAGLDTSTAGGSAIVPVVVGDSARTLRITDALLDSGVNVAPILHPAVEEDGARLRFFLTVDHTEAQIRDTVARLAAELQAVPSRG
jgi:8-amino-7-oxononanoate synthase